MRDTKHAGGGLALALLALLVGPVLLLAGVRPCVAQAVPAGERSPEDIEDERSGRLSYDPQGRRDPFRPLTGEAPTEEERSKYKDSLRGLLFHQAKLTAIVRTPDGAIAMFEGGPDRKGFPARVGDRFWNAFVYDIDYDSGVVTVREELDDPRLLKPYRDHPIPLHPNELAQPGGRRR